VTPALIDAALEIAENRRALLAEMAEALKAKDDSEVIRLAKTLCGVFEDETET